MDFVTANVTIVAVLVAVVIALALLAFVASRIRRVPPNEALIVVGRGSEKTQAGISSPQKVIIGGRTFIWPVFQEGFRLSLEQYQTPVEVQAIDSNYIRTAIKATVNFKVTGTEDGVRRAAQRYLLQQGQLPVIVQQSLEGSLRGLVGGQPVDDLVKNFSRLAADAVNETKGELAELGLQIETMNIREIETPGSTYLADRGRAEAAQARQNAEVREAEAERTAALARIENTQQTAERQLQLDLRQAQIKAETDRANAEALAAGELARAEQDRLVAEQESIAVKEQARVADERLNIEVRQPAAAQKYVAIQQAEADRDTQKATVEADVFRRTETARAAREAAENEAAAVEAAGRAEAAAISAKGLAEAEAVDALAVAQGKYGQAALASQVITALPDIAREMAAPLGNIEHLSVVSTDGANDLTKGVANNITQLQDVVKASTGLDLVTLLGGYLGGKAGATGSGLAGPGVGGGSAPHQEQPAGQA
ncbi:flotillin family protein [Frigoribacterium salinisoli]